MLQKIRAGTVTGILLGFGFTLWLTGTGRSHLFFPSNVRSETLSAAQYLLSSIVECLGSIFAVSIAVVFITAQVSGRSYARTVAEIYRDRTTFVVVSFFFASISLGIVCLARISSIVDTDRYWMIDVDIWLSLASLLFLFPLILAQVENVNPIHLAAKLASHIVTRNINKYGLSSVEIANTGEATYRLRMQEPFHPSGDPLGAFHEVVMGAVASRDRVSLSLQMRMLLKRIAVCAAVPYGMRLRSNPEGRFWQNMDQAYVFLHEPVRLTDQLSMTLHVLHYYIRRAANLRKEWGDLDAVRQQFVFNLEELIRSLNLRKGTDQLIEICFYATMHLSLSYADLPRYGRTEAFLSFVDTAIQLHSSGNKRQATLCVQLLALVAMRTSQLPPEFRAVVEQKLSPELRAIYDVALRAAVEDDSWLPGNADLDPWRHRCAGYKVCIPEHRIIISD